MDESEYPGRRFARVTLLGGLLGEEEGGEAADEAAEVHLLHEINEVLVVHVQDICRKIAAVDCCVQDAQERDADVPRHSLRSSGQVAVRDAVEAIYSGTLIASAVSDMREASSASLAKWASDLPLV